MRALLMTAVLALAACATPTPYQARTDASAYGFAERPLEANRVRLTFNGNALTDRETVETYLLYRAAQLTIERGFDYFVVANRGTEAHTQRYLEPRPPRMFAYRYYSPRWGWRYYDPFYDPFFDANEREVTRYEAVAEIAMFHGQKPADNADAFDAHDVMRTLGPNVRMPTTP